MVKDIAILNDKFQASSKKIQIEDITDEYMKTRISLNEINVEELKAFVRILQSTKDTAEPIDHK